MMQDITPEDSVAPVYLVPANEEDYVDLKAWADLQPQRDYDAVTDARLAGYQRDADPIFMQYQRGEATEQEWLDAVQAVKDANPYPEMPTA
jgi:hypothetical protein